MLKDYLRGKFSIMSEEEGDPEKTKELQKEIDMANHRLAEETKRKEPRVYEIESEDIEKNYEASLESLELIVGTLETLSVQLLTDKDALTASLYNANRQEALGQIEEIKSHYKKGKFHLSDVKLEKLIRRMEESFIETGSQQQAA